MTGDRPGRGQHGARPPDPLGGDPAQAAPAGQASGPSLLLDQAFDGSTMYQLRASVAAHAGDAGLSRTRTEDVVVAVHELAANVVRHGGGRGRLLVWRHHEELHCQITDDGGQDGAHGGPPWRIQPGHGLWLVGRLADRTSQQQGPHGVATTITFSLVPASSLAPFRLTRSTWPAGTILALSGQLDLNSAAELTDAVDDLLAGAPAARLVLDLAGLTFWDSFGLAALLRAQSRADANATARLILAGPPERLVRELSEAGLRERFSIAASADQAIAEATPPAP